MDIDVAYEWGVPTFWDCEGSTIVVSLVLEKKSRSLHKHIFFEIMDEVGYRNR